MGGTDEGGTGEVDPTLEFLNHETTNKGVLVGQVGAGAAATAIINYKNGEDGQPGTDDDQTFASIDDVDGLSGIGSKSLAKFINFAKNWTAIISDPVLVFLNTVPSSAVLEDEVGLKTAAAEALALVGGPFYSRYDVDAVPEVGPASIAALEVYSGLGHMELLGAGTSSNLLDITFNTIGEALIVGVPVGGTAHVLWFTPFCEDCFEGDDITYEFLPIEDIEDSLNAAAFDPTGETAILVGEAGGLFVFDAASKEVEFLPVDGVAGLVDVAWSATGTAAYAVSPESELIISYDPVTNTASEYAPMGGNALATASDLSQALLVVGDDGSVTTLDGAGMPTGHDLASGEPLFAAAWAAGAYLVAGSDGAAVHQPADWTRFPTRTLETIHDVAVGGDGAWIILVGSDGLVLRYTLATGEMAPIGAPTGENLTAVGVSDDGTAILVGTKGVVIQYNPDPIAVP